MSRLLALLAALALAAPALAFERGQLVLGRFERGSYWFPGVVQSAGSKSVEILYDDGDRETLEEQYVRRYDWQVGTQVECDWQGGGTWYAGRITALAGNTLVIAYDDGDREQTTTARCRSE